MKKKIISFLILAFMFVATMLTASGANTYYVPLSFSIPTHYGSWRNYTSAHITWQASLSAPTAGATSTIITASLFRQEDGTLVGSHTMPRNGWSIKFYNNARTGNRRFYYTKSNDGITVSSSGVIISSSSTPN